MVKSCVTNSVMVKSCVTNSAMVKSCVTNSAMVKCCVTNSVMVKSCVTNSAMVSVMINTVDREIFARKNIRLLNFRVVLFSSPRHTGSVASFLLFDVEIYLCF